MKCSFGHFIAHLVARGENPQLIMEIKEKLDHFTFIGPTTPLNSLPK